MRLKSFRVPEMAHILEEQLKDPNNQYLLCFEYLSLHILCTGRYKIGHHFPKFIKFSCFLILHQCDYCVMEFSSSKIKNLSVVSVF